MSTCYDSIPHSVSEGNFGQVAPKAANIRKLSNGLSVLTTPTLSACLVPPNTKTPTTRQCTPRKLSVINENTLMNNSYNIECRNNTDEICVYLYDLNGCAIDLISSREVVPNKCIDFVKVNTSNNSRLTHVGSAPRLHGSVFPIGDSESISPDHTTNVVEYSNPITNQSIILSIYFAKLPLFYPNCRYLAITVRLSPNLNMSSMNNIPTVLIFNGNIADNNLQQTAEDRIYLISYFDKQSLKKWTRHAEFHSFDGSILSNSCLIPDICQICGFNKLASVNTTNTSISNINLSPGRSLQVISTHGDIKTTTTSSVSSVDILSEYWLCVDRCRLYYIIEFNCSNKAAAIKNHYLLKSTFSRNLNNNNHADINLDFAVEIKDLSTSLCHPHRINYIQFSKLYAIMGVVNNENGMGHFESIGLVFDEKYLETTKLTITEFLSSSQYDVNNNTDSDDGCQRKRENIHRLTHLKHRLDTIASEYSVVLDVPPMKTSCDHNSKKTTHNEDKCCILM